jgi:hypothetical protein
VLTTWQLVNLTAEPVEEEEKKKKGEVEMHSTPLPPRLARARSGH